MKANERKLLGVVASLMVAVTALGQTTPTKGSGSAGSQTTSPLAGSITVAAAADLGPALQPIIEQFRKSMGGEVKVTYGASGTLTTQIEQGAPFDVFMSADMDYPKRLIEKKLADPKSLKTYTRGRLIVYVLPSVSADVAHAGVKALTDSSIQKIAIANPDHAPYGRAAVSALKHEGVYDQVKSKLVIAENVGQAAQFVKSGNAQAGIFALSAMSDRELRRRGRLSEVDLNAYPPLDQGAVVLKHGDGNPLARAFVQYLGTQMAQGLLVRYGFMPPTTYKDVGGPDAPNKKSSTPEKKSATPKKP